MQQSQPVQPVKTDSVPPPVPPLHTGKTDPVLENILAAYPQYFDSIRSRKEELGVQIIYTQIDRTAGNRPVFTRYCYNVDPGRYFYPASTVKMPVALLALQRLRELRIPGLNSTSTMITEQQYSRQTPVYNDPATPDGRPAVAQYIKKIFLVSDNDAFNRLYEFLGPQYINDRLHAMGYPQAEIRHRLAIPMSEDENRHTNPVSFFSPDGKSLYTQPMQAHTLPYLQRSDSAGNAYQTMPASWWPADGFLQKNRLSLDDLTGILQSICFRTRYPQAAASTWNRTITGLSGNICRSFLPKACILLMIRRRSMMPM